MIICNVKCSIWNEQYPCCYNTKQNSTVFTCFLNAAKAFDRVSHWTLFSKMIKKNVPIVIVRVITCLVLNATHVC